MPSHRTVTKVGKRLDRRVALVTRGGNRNWRRDRPLVRGEGARIAFCSRSEELGAALSGS